MTNFLSTYFNITCHLPHLFIFAMKMEAVYSCEMVLPDCKTSQCDDPEDHNIYAGEIAVEFPCTLTRDSGKPHPISMIKAKNKHISAMVMSDWQ
jgi:hypothetical protein